MYCQKVHAWDTFIQTVKFSGIVEINRKTICVNLKSFKSYKTVSLGKYEFKLAL